MKTTHRTILGAAVCLSAIALLAQPVLADEAMEKAEDDTWISVSGTIVSAKPAEFRLDYGDGIVTVEMDDFDFYADGYGLLANDEVVVTGVVDHDLFEKKKIEASTVYVESLGTHFYANPADEEGFAAWSYPADILVGRVEVTGTVTSVTGREFVVSTGVGRVEVDTASMVFNPMDDKGFLKIGVGDRVKVGGQVDKDVFDNHELSADTITKLDG